LAGDDAGLVQGKISILTLMLRILHMIVRRGFRSMGFESRALQLRTGSMHYLVRENPNPGGTVVFVHGIGTSSSSWMRVLKHLSTPRRIIVPDLPGYGYSSSHAARGYSTLEEHVDALKLLIDSETEGPVVLIGQSLGGWISARTAARSPHRVDRLILIDAAGINYPGVESLRDLFTVNSAQDTRRLLSSLWYRYPWYFRPFAGSIHRELVSRKMNEFVASVKRDDFLDEELELLTMPVTVIWGKQDKATLPISMDILKKKVPHAEVHTIDRCGHVPQLEHPAALAEILTRVLGK
jgi:pimeloyl-ACP methyl ester carboxylesterase